MSEHILYLGIKGSVVAIDKYSGREIWRTHLKGSSFVSLAIDRDVIFACTHGNLYCVDKDSGKETWHNGLSGLGYGLGMIALDHPEAYGAMMEQIAQAQQVAAAAAEAAAAAAASASAANS